MGIGLSHARTGIAGIIGNNGKYNIAVVVGGRCIDKSVQGIIDLCFGTGDADRDRTASCDGCAGAGRWRQGACTGGNIKRHIQVAGAEIIRIGKRNDVDPAEGEAGVFVYTGRCRSRNHRRVIGSGNHDIKVPDDGIVSVDAARKFFTVAHAGTPIVGGDGDGDNIIDVCSGGGVPQGIQRQGHIGGRAFNDDRIRIVVGHRRRPWCNDMQRAVSATALGCRNSHFNVVIGALSDILGIAHGKTAGDIDEGPAAHDLGARYGQRWNIIDRNDGHIIIHRGSLGPIGMIEVRYGGTQIKGPIAETGTIIVGGSLKFDQIERSLYIGQGTGQR